MSREPVWHPVGALADFEEDKPEAVDVDGTPIAVVRTSGGKVHAIHDVCSHANVALSEGEVVDGEIECWLHGSTFSLATGKPTCLPAVESVPVYPVKIEGDDVYVAVNVEL
ncbi:MAG TPA: non-heme iron oxygenase ferredoxin subunit [Actinocrinis sp.]|uniref:non-heme iron oxygenase ferredoxin subunit n=1 Tax=Actinocrinis sp. TaxID=1920516 RepID=UPI002DDD0371|nr:non-heme iron oxygenase ferredoxin subunit [Actinocrinis sp.]HEV2345968.1 non-heme iron oxygenase ferredoxin subunit [Actinocrinis sp.]